MTDAKLKLLGDYGNDTTYTELQLLGELGGGEGG